MPKESAVCGMKTNKKERGEPDDKNTTCSGKRVQEGILPHSGIYDTGGCGRDTDSACNGGYD